MGVLFPDPIEQFLISTQAIKNRALRPGGGHEYPAVLIQEPFPAKDILVRRPFLREPRSKVTVLQRWVGCVEQVKQDQFAAVLEDRTNPQNPREWVELDRSEVSVSDLPLLEVGATFYWSIGYRDTPDGQRERVSALRFARRPRLGDADIRHALEEADRIAAFLASD